MCSPGRGAAIGWSPASAAAAAETIASRSGIPRTQNEPAVQTVSACAAKRSSHGVGTIPRVASSVGGRSTLVQRGTTPTVAMSQGCQAEVQADSNAAASASSSQVGKSWREWQGRETAMRSGIRSGFMRTSLATVETRKRKREQTDREDRRARMTRRAEPGVNKVRLTPCGHRS